MKMIRAIIRPEKEEDVIKGLELAGCPSLTKMDVFGRGKQKGIQVGNAVYDSMVEKASASIRETCKTGNFGDGKIFVSPVESVVTIRTGKLGI